MWSESECSYRIHILNLWSDNELQCHSDAYVKISKIVLPFWCIILLGGYPFGFIAKIKARILNLIVNVNTKSHVIFLPKESFFVLFLYYSSDSRTPFERLVVKSLPCWIYCSVHIQQNILFCCRFKVNSILGTLYTYILHQNSTNKYTSRYHFIDSLIYLSGWALGNTRVWMRQWSNG